MVEVEKLPEGDVVARFDRELCIAHEGFDAFEGSSHALAILFELMTDFDEGLQEWRYRHVKTVERTIGSKQGTGGSPGVPFLKKSLFVPVFEDLWAIRHRL